MGGGSGFGGISDLERKTVQIKVGDKRESIFEITGIVTGVEGFNESRIAGYQKNLSIHVDCAERSAVPLFRFKGESPIRKGDSVRAGLILNKEFTKQALYVEIVGKEGPVRRDYMEGYDPLQVDARKLGLP